MPLTTRQDISKALFKLVDTAIGNVVTLKTSVRRMRYPKDVAPAQTPALFMRQLEEHYERSPVGILGIPPKRTIHYEFVLYTTDAANLQDMPSDQLNKIVQAVEAAFPFDGSMGQETLGGTVASARLEGKIGYLESPTLDGLSTVIIPIAVLIP